MGISEGGRGAAPADGRGCVVLVRGLGSRSWFAAGLGRRSGACLGVGVFWKFLIGMERIRWK